MRINVKNLKRLRAILDEVPPERLEMESFFSIKNGESAIDDPLDKGINDLLGKGTDKLVAYCGTSACMCGWAAADPVLNPHKQAASMVPRDAFNIPFLSDLGTFLFGGDWGSEEELSLNSEYEDALERLDYIIDLCERRNLVYSEDFDRDNIQDWLETHFDSDVVDRFIDEEILTP